MHPDDFSYYGLSNTASAVWELIDGTRSTDDIVAALAAEYDADEVTIRADVEAFLTGLRSAGIIASDR